MPFQLLLFSNAAQLMEKDKFVDKVEVNVCHVCNGEVGKAHSCLTCHRFIHIFCGTQQGEEGYGQKAICKKCNGMTITFLPNTISFVLHGSFKYMSNLIIKNLFHVACY